MQKLMKSLVLAAFLLLFVQGVAGAATEYYTFRVVDDAGAPVAGATFTQTSLKNIGTGATIAVTPTIVDLGSGVYSVAYDAQTNGEGVLVLSPTAGGHTFTNVNAAIPITMTQDSGYIASTNTRVTLALPAIAPNTTGGLPTNGTGAGQISLDGTGHVTITAPDFLSMVAPVESGMTAQGYTAARATNLDNIDAAVSTRLASSAYTAPPTDYQQRGVAVTLPTTPPTGYGASVTAPTASQVAAAVWGYNLDPLGSLYAGDAVLATWQVLGGTSTATTTATGGGGTQQVTSYKRADQTTIGLTTTLNKSSSGQPTSRTYTMPSEPQGSH